MNVLFVCIGNSGRSVMAERLFRRVAGERHQVRSAGVQAGRTAEPVVVEALGELGVDASDHVPRQLDQEAIDWADVVVTVCDDAACPVTPGKRRIAVPFPDPYGRAIEEVRPIRDAIHARVRELAEELG